MTELKGNTAGAVWQKAVQLAASKPRCEIIDLTVTIGNGLVEQGELDFQIATDGALLSDGKAKVGTVANTIFPSSLWRSGMCRTQFYARYLELWPRLQKKQGNSRGTYFKRLIDYPGAGGCNFNQIEHVIGTYKKKIRRRSTLQCSILNPATDLRSTPFQGFPCLQQLAFQPSKDGLRVVAFYPTQYLWRRGYGNYLGLMALGRFVAGQLDMPFKELTCISLSAQLDGPKAKHSLLKPLLEWSL